jgi:N-acetylmuramoyl-L-alanine amidase
MGLDSGPGPWGEARCAGFLVTLTRQLTSEAFYERGGHNFMSLRRTVAAAAAGACFALSSTPAFAAEHVTVRPGDTLWSIARAEHVSLSALEAANPQVRPRHLLPGTVLNIPDPQKQYIVRRGDTLWSIAQRYGVTLSALMDANRGVVPTRILPGMLINIPAGSDAAAFSWAGHTSETRSRAVPHVAKYVSAHVATLAKRTAHAVDNESVYWLARLIYAEAGGESLKAQIAVGDVVLHRMASPAYPDTVKDVIFQKSGGHYEFACVENGTIHNDPSPTSIQAAQMVLERHVDVVPGAYFFYNPAQTSANNWIRSQPRVAHIGSLVFAG